MKEEYLAKSAKVDPCVNQCAMRQSAVSVLGDLTAREHRKTRGLETLMKVIPWNILSREDEEALYNYFCEHGRR